MQWRQLERNTRQSFPYYLTDEDYCIFARDYISKGSYNVSECNRLIKNFKKAPALRHTNYYEWRHKPLAIEQFARELHLLEFPSDNDFALVAIPTSKFKTSTEYDSRLDETLNMLSSLRGNRLTIETPFSIIKEVVPKHEGGTRDLNSARANLRWDGFRTVPSRVIIVDDVITTGCGFKVCKELIQTHHPNIQISGVFWAVTIWPEETRSPDG